MEHCNSKSTTAAILTLLGVLLVLVDCKVGPDISIVRGPTCTGISKNNGYTKSVGSLLDTLVKETKNVHRDTIHQIYRYTRQIPDSEPGSVTGTAVCSGELGKSECWECLAHAQGKLTTGCVDPVKGSIKLQDCSIWFDKKC